MTIYPVYYKIYTKTSMRETEHKFVVECMECSYREFFNTGQNADIAVSHHNNNNCDNEGAEKSGFLGKLK